MPGSRPARWKTDVVVLGRSSTHRTTATTDCAPARPDPIAGKFAPHGAVLQLAKELATDIRVNGIAPGATDDVRALGSALIAQGPIPPQAAIDALHIAIAAVNGMEYLLTWNCADIANAVMRPRIEGVCGAKATNRR